MEIQSVFTRNLNRAQFLPNSTQILRKQKTQNFKNIQRSKKQNFILKKFKKLEQNRFLKIFFTYLGFGNHLSMLKSFTLRKYPICFIWVSQIWDLLESSNMAIQIPAGQSDRDPIETSSFYWLFVKYWIKYYSLSNSDDLNLGKLLRFVRVFFSNF